MQIDMVKDIQRVSHRWRQREREVDRYGTYNEPTREIVKQVDSVRQRDGQRQRETIRDSQRLTDTARDRQIHTDRDRLTRR